MTAPALFLATLGLSALSFGKGESCHPHFCRLGHLLPLFLEILPSTVFTIPALPSSFLYVPSWQAQPPPNFQICGIKHLGARFGKSKPYCPCFCRPSHQHLQHSHF